jgi:hypothetical protein
MAARIRQRHGNRRSRKGRMGGVRLPQARREEDQESFSDQAAAVARTDDSRSAVRKGAMQAPTGATLAHAAEAWLELARSGLVRTRSGEIYEPATIRSYDQTLELRIYDELGDRRLSVITRNDLQDLSRAPRGARG